MMTIIIKWRVVGTIARLWCGDDSDGGMFMTVIKIIVVIVIIIIIAK